MDFSFVKWKHTTCEKHHWDICSLKDMEKSNEYEAMDYFLRFHFFQ